MLNIIFIHTHFPGPFGLLAQIFGRDTKNNTVFITSADQKTTRQIPGVKTLFFDHTSSAGHKEIRRGFNRPGRAVAQILADLKKQPFEPDLIIGHCGPGTTFYVKDVFPDTPFLGFFEWYHRPEHFQDKHGKADGSELTRRMEMRHRNLFILSDLCACNHGICPTAWQKKQFPEIFHHKLSVVHPSIDTRAFQPVENQVFKTDFLDLSDAEHLITYTTNTLAPHMGFRQLMESLPAVLKQKPGAHIVIVGQDRIFFENSSGEKKSYKSMICEKTDLNPGQVHFLENLAQDHYKTLLQASSVHVYLDSPFVVSPSLLQAMACECLVMAPDTAAVQEIISDGTNGLIVDFYTPDKISKKILACLDYPSFMTAVKKKARQTIVEKCAIEKTLPRQLKIIKTLMTKNNPEPFG
jgi:glycosyltransferase involved in cell wall biosynthesis